MRSSVAFFLRALGAGVLVTVVLTLASYFLFEVGATNLSTVLFWPNALLQGAAPCVKIDSSVTGRLLCEGTPLNEVAFLASFPLSIAVYSAIAYIFIRRRARGGT
jgi:hypothetical protein